MWGWGWFEGECPRPLITAARPLHICVFSGGIPLTQRAMPSLAFLDFCTTARCFPCVATLEIRGAVAKHSVPRPRTQTDQDWMFPEEVRELPTGPDALGNMVLTLPAFQAVVMQLLQVRVWCVCGACVVRVWCVCGACVVHVWCTACCDVL